MTVVPDLLLAAILEARSPAASITLAQGTGIIMGHFGVTPNIAIDLLHRLAEDAAVSRPRAAEDLVDLSTRDRTLARVATLLDMQPPPAGDSTHGGHSNRSAGALTDGERRLLLEESQLLTRVLLSGWSALDVPAQRSPGSDGAARGADTPLDGSDGP